MEHTVKFPNSSQMQARRFLFILAIVAVTCLVLQTLMLPYRNVLQSLLPANLASVEDRVFLSSSIPLKSAAGKFVNPSNFDGSMNDKVKSRDSMVLANAPRTEQVVESGYQIRLDNSLESIKSSSPARNESLGHWSASRTVPSVPETVPNDHIIRDNSLSELEMKQSDFTASGNGSVIVSKHRRKKIRPGMPPLYVKSIHEMNRILARHLVASKKMKYQGSSLRDKEILDAKWKILNGPAPKNDPELYAPIFRNISMFLRSYEQMERTLRVYVYKDGEKLIFHQPILKGLYASEGWFMKLMEGNKQFVVKNPEKAHLFYMPFSSRMLEHSLYVQNSRNRTNLREFVKEYREKIAAKYPFWNRTGGTDHFLVACRDWALYETRHHMENTIKALCNADITIGFKIGRDISLPETYVRYPRSPLRDLGGKPPSKRHILAFDAGNSYGYVRPILLKQWKDKDPDMKIYGLLPSSVARKMSYIEHMKSSRYCICPKGYEVNSPRVVEAIFYECVPVIISDNFVPPFFEVLIWEAFSVIVAEKDMANLKDTLMSIPKEKYLEMQLTVRKVQRHFLWHARPVKYDLFYFTLHSIWNNRVFRIS